MPQTPLLPGDPSRPRDNEIRWFEPVIAPRRPAGQPLVADSANAPPLSPRREAKPWRERDWVGFAGDGPAPDPALMAAPQPPRASPLGVAAIEVAAQAAPLPGTEEADAAVPRRVAAIAISAGAALRLRQRLRSSTSRLLRLGAAVASVGVLAVFALQGGERSAAPAGAMTPAAAPGHRAAALPASDGDRAPAVSSSEPRERTAYYLDRARAGDPVAQFNIGALYARGDGPAQDFSRAAAWFREAASTGNIAAQFDLAVMYERGLGVAENMSKAVAWYQRAADQNYAPAQYNLAIAYAEGRGAPQDAVTAASWYHQAAAQGLVPAMVNFAILYERGEGVERSLPDAYAWYRAAARGGDAGAAQRARELFQQFTGSEKGQAVMLAAAIAGTLQQPQAGPRAGLPEPAGPGGAVMGLVPGGALGRDGLKARPGPVQPPG